MGRPTKFNEAIQSKMLELFEKGKTVKQIAEIIGVSIQTIHNWKNQYPDFLYALRESRQIADELVVASVFNRAIGYSHPEEKVFCYEGSIYTHNTLKQYPPDMKAAEFWLRNRQPDLWDKSGDGETNITVNLADRVAKARKRVKE